MTYFSLVRVMLCAFAAGALLPIMGAAPAVAQSTYVCDGTPGEVTAGMSQGGNGIASMPLCWDTPYVPEERPVPPGMDIPYDPAKAGRWWGSIVEGPSHRVYTSFGLLKQKEAEQVAMGKCRTDPAINGAVDACRPLKTHKMSDVAMAFDGTTYYLGGGGRGIGMPFEKEIANALKACRKGSAADKCHISLLFNPISGPLPEDQARLFLPR